MRRHRTARKRKNRSSVLRWTLPRGLRRRQIDPAPEDGRALGRDGGDGVLVGARPRFRVTMVAHMGVWRAVIRPDVIGLEPIVERPCDGMATARRLIAEALRATQDSFDIDFKILDPDSHAGAPVLRRVEIEIKDESEITEAHRILRELEETPAETEADLLVAYDDLNLTVRSLLEILGRPAR